MQPKGSAQVVINEGVHEEDDYFDEDVETRMAIPNEMEIRMTTRSTSNTGIRKVKVLKDPSHPPTPTLPFKPPGLRWKGQPAITTRQLVAQLEARKRAQCNGLSNKTT